MAMRWYPAGGVAAAGRLFSALSPQCAARPGPPPPFGWAAHARPSSSGQLTAAAASPLSPLATVVEREIDFRGFAQGKVNKLTSFDSFGALALREPGRADLTEGFQLARTDPLVVLFFTSPRATRALLLQPGFAAVATAAGVCDPAATTGRAVPKIFLQADVDQIPRAAYRCDVDDLPTIVLMRGDDAFRVKIAPVERSDTAGMLPKLEKALEEFDRTSLAELNALTSKSNWYSHAIGVDNLNARDLHWPER